MTDQCVVAKTGERSNPVGSRATDVLIYSEILSHYLNLGDYEFFSCRFNPPDSDRLSWSLRTAFWLANHETQTVN
jgi:hypothetical protein